MSLVVGTIEELEYRLNAFGVALVGAPLGRQLIEALARAEKAEADAAASWQFAELARVKAKEAGDRAFRASERANSAERERDAMHAAAEELRAQGAALGEDECEAKAWRGDRFKMRVVPDGLELTQVTGITKGWSATFYPATLKHAADEYSDPNGWPRALAYFDAHRPLLPDECREQGKPPRKMVDGEVRLLNGAPTTIKMRGAEVVIAPVVSGRGWWWHPRWHGDGQVCADHPANDPSQVDRIIAFWSRNAPADLCLTDDGRSVRTMATNEVRDVVTGKGLGMTIEPFRSSRPSSAIIGERFSWVQGSEALGHETHPCSLPSNRLRVEAFLVAQDSQKETGGRRGAEPGPAQSPVTSAQEAPPAVLPEAHSGSPSGDKLADMLTGSVEEWIKAGHLGLAHSTLVGAVTVGLLSSGRAAEVAGMSMRDWRAVEQRVLRPSHTMAVSKMVSAAVSSEGPSNGTGRKTEESDGQGPEASRVREDVDSVPEVRTVDGAGEKLHRLPAGTSKPPCIPSHIADTDWTVIEGRAVWRDGLGCVRLEDRTVATFGGWLFFQHNTYESLRGMQRDVPQSLFIAARRWMGWERTLTAVDLTELREAWKNWTPGTGGLDGFNELLSAIEKLLSSGGAP